MAEDAQAGTAAGAANGEGDAQRRSTVPPITLGVQYVKDLSFENPNSPKILRTAPGVAPQVRVSVDVRTNQLDNEQTYEVVLHIRADAKVQEDEAFIVELTYASVVTIGSEAQRSHYAPLLLIEAPRLLFPFARAIVAEATRNGGFPPLMIQPVDFVDLYRRQMEAVRQYQEQQKAGAAAEPQGTA